MSFVDVSAYSTLFAFQTVNTVPALAFVPEVATKSKNPAVNELVEKDAMFAVEPDVIAALFEY